MGLGKTIEGIVLADMYNLPVLVVAPKSILKQWQQKIKEWVNEDATIISGTNTKDKYFISKWSIIGYEKLLRDNTIITKVGNKNKREFKILIDLPPQFILIADEASKLKSYQTDIYKFFRLLSFRATKKILLTGTPIENNLTDIFNIIKIVSPGFMDIMTFRDQFCIFKKIRVKNYKYNPENPNSSPKRQIELLCGYKNLDVFLNKISPYFIRRRREDVFDQLPELQQENRIVELSSLQTRVYNKIIDTARESGKDKFAILSLLRLVATDLRLFKESESEFIDTIKDIDMRNIEEKGSKIQELKDIFNECDGQILVFSQFKRMVNLIKEEMKDCLVVTGETPEKEKNKTIDEFKAGKGRILLSTDTLAYGQDFKMVPTLINFDLPWNPQKLQQRISRIFSRLGGLNKSLIINIITESIEDRLLEVLGIKTELFNKLVNGEIVEDESIRKLIISKFIN